MKSNKELREEYKLKKFRIGVFQIRNTVNEKVFIDSSVNLDAIRNRHFSELNAGATGTKYSKRSGRSLGARTFYLRSFQRSIKPMIKQTTPNRPNSLQICSSRSASLLLSVVIITQNHNC
jgi:hypothetical protein